MTERSWKTGERLWQEDDATLQDPTAEKVGQAWQRIFGEKLGATIGRPMYDLGDCYGFLMPNGATYEESYDGAAIYAPDGKTMADFRK